MKYTSPIYNNEAVNTSDVICTSPYSVAHVTKTFNDPNTNEKITATVTEVTVEASKLF